MKHFLKTNLIVAATVGAAMLASCASHKLCGDPTAKPASKYSSKRYRKSLMERDSLCNLDKEQKTEIARLNKNYSDLDGKYNQLLASSGYQLDKLSTDLGNKQAAINQKDARLRQLESILMRQDSILNELNNSVKKALLGFNPDELSVEMKNGKVYVSLSDKLLFKSGDANVEAKGKEALKKLATELNKNPDVSISIEGHTDNVPIKTAIYKDNWDLSTARATNVVRLLSDEYGVDVHRLTASGKSEYFPVADNATPEGKAKNRRTEIVLSPKLDILMKLINAK